jgi:hypothetical protein
LVEEGGQEVGVVDDNWQLNQDILVRKLGLLQTKTMSAFL